LLSYSAEVDTADAAVVGCGPAGLSLAAELASRGVSVVLIGEGYLPLVSILLYAPLSLLAVLNMPDLPGGS
jgi:flavin-dependent dehydrogenase